MPLNNVKIKTGHDLLNAFFSFAYFWILIPCSECLPRLHTQTFYGSFAHLPNTLCLLRLSSVIYHNSLKENLRFLVFIAKGVSVIVVGALCASIAVATRLQCSTTRPYRAALTWCRAYSRAQWRIGRLHCLAGCNSLQSVDIPHAWQVCTLYRLKKEMIEFIVVCSAMQPVKKSAAAGASCRRHTVADFLYIMYVLFAIDTPTVRGVIKIVSRDQLNWSLTVLTKFFSFG